MTAARIRAQFPTSDGFGDQLKGCCRPPFVWASYNISRYIGRHSSRENNVPYCSHYSSSNTVSLRTGVFRPCTRGHVRLLGPTHVQLLFTWNLSPLQSGGCSEGLGAFGFFFIKLRQNDKRKGKKTIAKKKMPERIGRMQRCAGNP